VVDSPAFDDWLLLKDDKYRRSLLGVLGLPASHQLARGETDAAR
jgi:hypothetical protein